jgi:hypothetical protein
MYKLRAETTSKSLWGTPSYQEAQRAGSIAYNAKPSSAMRRSAVSTSNWADADYAAKTKQAIRASNAIARFERVRDAGLLLLSLEGFRVIVRRYDRQRYADRSVKPDELTLVAIVMVNLLKQQENQI